MARQRRPLPPVRKTSAMASDKPTFMSRNNNYNNDYNNNSNSYKGGAKTSSYKSAKSLVSLTGGNLANPTLNPLINSGIKLNSNSAPVFPAGPSVRIIPLGGVSEVGMNMTAIECGNDIIVVDAGMGFGGGEKFPGVDYVIPDTTYLEENITKVRGIIFTHGHLDHIGAAPYILPKLPGVPIFGMPLTLSLLKNRLLEFELPEKIIAKIVRPDQNLILGCFNIGFFRLNHSIPDVVGLDIQTPMGRIAYCTDWKFDNTPFDGQVSDYAKLAQMGAEGVRVLLTDSLGVMKPGYQVSERVIGNTIKKIFEECQARVIVTAFSTTVSRIQFTIDACVKYNRKLSLIGRSMITNFKTCAELGYIRVPAGLVVDLADLVKLDPKQVCILSTGSQGEDMAALSRMARDEHDQVRLQGGDSVIFTSNPIPGNEESVADLIAKLSRKGVAVYQNKEFQLHVSGHACQEDLKLLFTLCKPDYLQPIHGDHYMLEKVGELGASVGIPPEHCLIGENGRITELRADGVYLLNDIITDKYLLVDGTGVGAVSEAVLMERRQMATQGCVIITLLINKQKQLITADVVSRGFVYMKTSRDLIDDIKNEVTTNFANINLDKGMSSFFAEMRSEVRTMVKNYIYKTIEKEPEVIPVIVQM
jgi:ribonuclease J